MTLGKMPHVVTHVAGTRCFRDTRADGASLIVWKGAQMRRNRKVVAAAIAVALSFPFPCIAADTATTDVGTDDKESLGKVFPDKRPYSPYAGRNFPTRPFFGDTHLHTSYSMDAGAFGARLGPREAYRFARGEEVTTSTGQQ